MHFDERVKQLKEEKAVIIERKAKTSKLKDNLLEYHAIKTEESAIYAKASSLNIPRAVLTALRDGSAVERIEQNQRIIEELNKRNIELKRIDEMEIDFGC